MGKNKQAVTSVFLTIEDGIDQFAKGSSVRLTQLIEEQKLEIKAGQNPPAYMSFSQIIDASLITEEEIIEKEKSVIGRAAVGGILLGPLGAIVGGTSGIGTKKKINLVPYLVITYKASGSDEIKTLMFETVKILKPLFEDFVAELLKNAGVPANDHIDQTEINL